MKDKCVTSSRMAGWLMYNGMAPLETRQDRYDPERLVWIFRDSETLQRLMTAYSRAPYVAK